MAPALAKGLAQDWLAGKESAAAAEPLLSVPHNKRTDNGPCAAAASRRCWGHSLDRGCCSGRGGREGGWWVAACSRSKGVGRDVVAVALGGKGAADARVVGSAELHQAGQAAGGRRIERSPPYWVQLCGANTAQQEAAPPHVRRHKTCQSMALQCCTARVATETGLTCSGSAAGTLKACCCRAPQTAGHSGRRLCPREVWCR